MFWQWAFSRKLSAPIRKCQLFVVSEPLRVVVLTHWHAPATGDIELLLPVSTQLRANEDAAIEAPGLQCVPALVSA